MPENRYQALAGQASFSEKKVEMAWNLGDHDWPRTNAQGLQLESGAWQLLCSCHATDSWEKLPLAWLSMLAPKGTLLRKTGISDSVFIVLETSQHGVLRWPARREYNQELQLELWQPSTADDASATWEPVLDAADWEIAFVHAVGPEFIEAAYGQGTWADGASPPVRTTPSGFSHELYLMRTTRWLSLWVAGAKEGFARLGDKHLNSALRETNAVPHDQPRPTHKLAKVLALMRWAVPSWSDEDCAAVTACALFQPQFAQSHHVLSYCSV